jgi:chaperonin GroES
MKIQPLNSRVLVKTESQGEKKIGSLYLPETSGESPTEGTIVELPAEGIENLSQGDRVIFKKHSGEEVRLGGEKMLFLESADLLAKVIETDEIPD